MLLTGILLPALLYEGVGRTCWGRQFFQSTTRSRAGQRLWPFLGPINPEIRQQWVDMGPWGSQFSRHRTFQEGLGEAKGTTWCHSTFGNNLSPDFVAPTWGWTILGVHPLLSFLHFPPRRSSFEWEQEFRKVIPSGKLFRANIRDFLGFSSPHYVCRLLLWGTWEKVRQMQPSREAV